MLVLKTSEAFVWPVTQELKKDLKKDLKMT